MIYLTVDYSRTVVEVYTNFTRQCIERYKSLDVLEYNRESEEGGVSDLPSWVPDWSVELTVQLFRSGVRKPLFMASAGMAYLSSELETSFSSSLTVRGKIIDNIVAEIEHDSPVGNLL